MNKNMSETVVSQPQRWPERAELQVDTETVSYNRVYPPPYTNEIPTISATTEPQVIQQTIIIQQRLSSRPVTYTCPSCRERVVTRVEYINSRKTHMMAGFICGLTFWCMLCCLSALPYLMTTFKEAVHYCPNCKSYLGSYSRVL